MDQMDKPTDSIDDRGRLDGAYRSEKPRLVARLLAAGRTIEEAEDLVHDVYAETLERLPLVSGIRNLPAWINTLFTRRLIDAWRHEAQVFGGLTFREIAEATGEGIDTLTARKRYALRNLARILKRWIEE